VRLEVHICFIIHSTCSAGPIGIFNVVSINWGHRRYGGSIHAHQTDNLRDLKCATKSQSHSPVDIVSVIGRLVVSYQLLVVLRARLLHLNLQLRQKICMT
jgi:hypothetical protein